MPLPAADRGGSRLEWSPHERGVDGSTISRANRATGAEDLVPLFCSSGGEAVGLAQVVGQCGSDKPDPRTPLAGLYLVGCDAGGRGAGTHQAVDSGFNVAEMVVEDLG